MKSLGMDEIIVICEKAEDERFLSSDPTRTNAFPSQHRFYPLAQSRCFMYNFSFS